MSMTQRPFPPLIPVHHSGCTIVCVIALVRLLAVWSLRFLPVTRTYGVFSSASAISRRQQPDCLAGSCSLPLPCAQRWWGFLPHNGHVLAI
jgi:hypothetical protein